MTILDRDRLPEEALPRSGLPQARHLHALMVGGQRSLEALLPGITARLVAAGAELFSWTNDVAVHTLAGWHRRFPSDLASCFMSRDLLDREVRRAVAILPGVKTCHGHEVTALAGRNGSVDGVRCRVRGAEGGERSFAADLVVDASGRESRAERVARRARLRRDAGERRWTRSSAMPRGSAAAPTRPRPAGFRCWCARAR